MLSAGKNITSPSDELSKIHLEQAYTVIVNSKNSVAEKVSLLRELKTIDTNAYKKSKTNLPYMVVGCFHPMHRLKVNFSFAEHLILDIDQIPQKGLDLNELKNRIAKDLTVALLFDSPGGDGLKVIFNLAERIYDASYYSAFYKKFAWIFAQKYALETLVDFKTHDVTRCCFFSHDAHAHYNFMAVNIKPTDYVNEDEILALKDIQKLDKDIQKTIEEKTKGASVPNYEKPEINDETLLQIKRKLNPNYRPPVKKHIYEPPQLDEVMDKIAEKLSANQIELIDSKSIHFGKQLRLKSSHYSAEVNIFYGKKGYSVVKTTKSGTTPELTELCYQLLCDILL